jgi:predicted HTH domain antitoxin
MSGLILVEAHMTTFTVELQIPESLHELGFTSEEICREVPTLLVLKRYREGLISSGKAAEILGLSRRDFIELLARERVALYDPSDDELQAELETIRRLERDAT